MDNPKDAPKEQDISYSVMPNMARKAVMALPPEPPKPPQPPSGPSAIKPASVSGGVHFNRRIIYLAGAVILVIVLMILVYAMVQKNKDKRNQPALLETKLPKVWLNQHFGAEACIEAELCADDADPDADGLTNYNEFKEGTNPKQNDNDSDGLADGDEVNIYKSDPGLKYTDRRDVAATNDYNDAVSVANEYDPLTPGIKMTASRLQQITDDTARYQLHEPTPTTLQQLKPGGAPAAKTVSLFIENGMFNPVSLIINIGDTVVWLNKEQIKHMVASNPHPQHTGLAGLVSPELGSNQTFSFKFENAGTFGYHDHLNPQIKGSIQVK